MHLHIDTQVPVPRTYTLCEDSSIIGTPFYIMSYVEGRLFKYAHLPGLSARERHACYSEMLRVLTLMHSLDYKALGLGDLAKNGGANYTQRQVCGLRTEDCG